MLVKLAEQYREVPDPELHRWLQPRLEELVRHLPLSEEIEQFWIDEMNKGTKNWNDHRDINMVMLATTLAPEQFLKAVTLPADDFGAPRSLP